MLTRQKSIGRPLPLAAAVRKGGLKIPINFFVPGPPQGKARARTVRARSGRSVSYTPQKTVFYEGRIRQCFCEAANIVIKAEPYYTRGIPVFVAIEAHYRPPARTSRKKLALMQDGQLLPIRKPDVDNIVKAVCDALNGWAYHDDAQVVRIAASKWYSGEEGLWVTVGSALEGPEG